MRTLTLYLAIGFLAMACKKSLNSDEEAAKQRSADFTASIQQHTYKLVAFYSDKAIDYITNDTEVRSETDLWSYVKPHVIDDESYFASGGILTINQKLEKFPGNDSEQINGSYGISAKGSDVVFKYVDYIYLPIEYKLQEFTNAYFIVYLEGPASSKLYSKFARID
jgi:hypothetical protein